MSRSLTREEFGENCVCKGLEGRYVGVEREILCGLDPLTWAGWEASHFAHPSPNTRTEQIHLKQLSSVFNLKPSTEQRTRPRTDAGGTTGPRPSGLSAPPATRAGSPSTGRFLSWLLSAGEPGFCCVLSEVTSRVPASCNPPPGSASAPPVGQVRRPRPRGPGELTGARKGGRGLLARPRG